MILVLLASHVNIFISNIATQVLSDDIKIQ